MKERLDRLFDTISKNGLKMNLRKWCSRINFCRLKINKQRNYTRFIKSRSCDKRKRSFQRNRSKKFYKINKLLLTIYTRLCRTMAELTEPLRKLKKNNIN